MVIKDQMNKFLEVNQGTLVRDAATLMDKHGTGSALVVEKDKPVGVITERDLLRKVVAKGLDPAELKVQEIMSSPIVTIKAKKRVKDAYQLMDEKNIRRLAVVNEEGEIIGKVTAHGISRNFGFQKFKKSIVKKPRQYYAKNVR